MTVDAYREKIIETVVRVFNELTDYRFSKSADMPESIAYAFPPTLSYIPDGMSKAEENAGEQLYTVTYEGETETFFDLSCTIFTDETQTEKFSIPKMCNRPSLSCMEKRQRFSARTEPPRSSGRMTMCCITCTVQFQLMNCARSRRILNKMKKHPSFQAFAQNEGTFRFWPLILTVAISMLSAVYDFIFCAIIRLHKLLNHAQPSAEETNARYRHNS